MDNLYSEIERNSLPMLWVILFWNQHYHIVTDFPALCNNYSVDYFRSHTSQTSNTYEHFMQFSLVSQTSNVVHHKYLPHKMNFELSTANTKIQQTDCWWGNPKHINPPSTMLISASKLKVCCNSGCEKIK